jgi:hypothetical protein
MWAIPIDDIVEQLAPKSRRARCVEADDATNILAEIDAEHGNIHDLPFRLNFRRI